MKGWKYQLVAVSTRQGWQKLQSEVLEITFYKQDTSTMRVLHSHQRVGWGSWDQPLSGRIGGEACVAYEHRFDKTYIHIELPELLKGLEYGYYQIHTFKWLRGFRYNASHVVSFQALHDTMCSPKNYVEVSP